MVLLQTFACSKSNYLEVGKPATITDNQGIYLRATPTPQGRKIVLIPVGADVNVLAEGLPEKLYDIKSKWYRVRYHKYEGWMWGGLAKSELQANDQKPTAEDKRQINLIAGSYTDTKSKLQIYCDGTLHLWGADAGDQWESFGRIVGSNIRITKSTMAITVGCMGSDICKVERSADFKVREEPVSEYMKGYEIESKRKCK